MLDISGDFVEPAIDAIRGRDPRLHPPQVHFDLVLDRLERLVRMAVLVPGGHRFLAAERDCDSDRDHRDLVEKLLPAVDRLGHMQMKGHGSPWHQGLRRKSAADNLPSGP